MTSTVKGFRFSSSTQTCIDTSQMYMACYVCTQTLADILEYTYITYCTFPSMKGLAVCMAVL